MGLLTWVIIAIVVLAVIGMGVGIFFSEVFEGAEKVAEIAEDATTTIQNDLK